MPTLHDSPFHKALKMNLFPISKFLSISSVLIPHSGAVSTEIYESIMNYSTSSAVDIVDNFCTSNKFLSIYKCLTFAFEVGLDRNFSSNNFYRIALKNAIIIFEQNINFDAIFEKLLLGINVFSISSREWLIKLLAKKTLAPLCLRKKIAHSNF